MSDDISKAKLAAQLICGSRTVKIIAFPGNDGDSDYELFERASVLFAEAAESARRKDLGLKGKGRGKR